MATIGKQTRSSAFEPAPAPAGPSGQAGPGKTTLTGALGGGAMSVVPPGTGTGAGEARELGPDERLVSKAPAHTTEAYLETFRHEAQKAMTQWGLAFDPSSLQIVMIKLGSSSVTAVVLTWNPAWGPLPVTRKFPDSLRPLDARAAITSVHALAGWDKVPHADRGPITHLLGGEENELSAASRDHLRPSYQKLKGENEHKQVHALTGTLHVKHALPNWEPEPMPKDIATFTLSGPHEKKGFAFAGKVADGEEYVAHYSDGVNVKIIAPKAPKHGYHNHTVRQTADAAAHMPKSARAVIKLIMLNPVTNPADKYWAAHYHIKHFHSYMTAGADGIVTIYPDKVSHDLPDATGERSAMVHETGHTWSFTHWGEDTTKGKWLHWKKAMKADKTSVSGYATNAITEDVAETIRIYVSTKHTPRFAEYQAIVPHRFAILKKEYDK